MTKTNPALIYNLFPLLAGSFSQWKSHIDRAAKMRFTHLYVNPVVYPGFSGSLYSIKDNDRINPLFLDNKPNETEWQQFKNIVVYTHERGLKFIFDLVLNHTAIDSPWTEKYPGWYYKDDSGNIRKPFCIDNGQKIVWGDLAELDFENLIEHPKLKKYWTDYVLKIIGFGVDGFRCDAAYQVPADFWTYLIKAARKENPEIEFFAETLGCNYDDVLELGKAGFDYSFNSSKYWDFMENWALDQNSQNVGVIRSISFAESHDTNRLAADFNNLTAGIKLKYLFSAIFSSGVMMPIGLEFGFNKKLDVVKTRPEMWEKTEIDLLDFITRANELKHTYPVFSQDSIIKSVESGEGITALLKTTVNSEQKVLIIINHDPNHHHEFYHPDLYSLFSSENQLTEVSLDFAQDSVPNQYHYNLRPYQIILLLQV